MLDHFGILAPYYDRVIQLRNVEKLIALANLPVQGALLDAGGGTGRVAGALRSQASSVVVADLSMDMLRQAARKGGLQLALSLTETLPFEKESFERVIMVDALHHVYDPVKTCKELWRVLRPGGRLVIEEPDIRTLAAKLMALAEKLALMRSRFISPPEIAGFFRIDPAARTSIQHDGFNAWVIVDKTGPSLSC